MRAASATTGSDQPTGNLVGTIDGKSGSAASPTRPPSPIGVRGEPGPITRPILPIGARFEVMAAGLSPVAFFLQTTKHQRGNSINETDVNGAIRAKEVLVIAPDGAQIGVELNEALWLAERGSRSRGSGQCQTAGLPADGLRQVQIRAVGQGA